MEQGHLFFINTDLFFFPKVSQGDRQPTFSYLSLPATKNVWTAWYCLMITQWHANMLKNPLSIFGTCWITFHPKLDCQKNSFHQWNHLPFSNTLTLTNPMYIFQARRIDWSLGIPRVESLSII